MRARPRDVQAARHLRARPGDVDLEPSAPDLNPRVDAHGPAEVHTVVVEEALGLDGGPRPGRKLRPRALGRLLEQALHPAEHRPAAVAAAQLLEALRASPARRELRLEVARRRVGVPDVRPDQVPQAAAPATGLDEEHRREDQPLLVELGVLGVLRAGRGPADVDVVGDRARVADQPAAHVNRGEDLEVGQVRAAQVGVVGQRGVARPERAEGVEHPGERELHQPELGRDHLRVGDHPTASVEEPAREVEHLADDRRERRPVLDDGHLLGDAVKRVRRISWVTGSIRFTGAPGWRCRRPRAASASRARRRSSRPRGGRRPAREPPAGRRGRASVGVRARCRGPGASRPRSRRPAARGRRPAGGARGTRARCGRGRRAWRRGAAR